MSEPQSPARPRPVSLVRGPRGRRIAIIKGQDYGRFTDFYHGVLTASWPLFFLELLTAFILVNLLFALLYVGDPGGIANARPGNFADAFFFSVQTLGTLGYGVMAPKTLYANLLVTVESFSGILTIALFTGIIFARFSRPQARVVFSNVAVVTPFDGVPTLMFRAANQRGNSILDAEATVSLASRKVTLEGIEMRRFEELKLVRNRTSLFALSWTVMHAIDEKSPLYGLTEDNLADNEVEILVMLSGVDDTLADRIYARHSYGSEDIHFDRRFADVLSTTPGGRRVVDLNRFHDTEPILTREADAP